MLGNIQHRGIDWDALIAMGSRIEEAAKAALETHLPPNILKTFQAPHADYFDPQATTFIRYPDEWSPKRFESRESTYQIWFSYSSEQLKLHITCGEKESIFRCSKGEVTPMPSNIDISFDTLLSLIA